MCIILNCWIIDFSSMNSEYFFASQNYNIVLFQLQLTCRLLSIHCKKCNTFKKSLQIHNSQNDNFYLFKLKRRCVLNCLVLFKDEFDSFQFEFEDDHFLLFYLMTLFKRS